MRGDPSTMEVLRPKAAREAVRLLARHPEAIPLAGGTDFMVSWNAGQRNGKTILDLSSIKEWARIRSVKDGLRIGTLVNHWQLQNHATGRRHLSSLGGLPGLSPYRIARWRADHLFCGHLHGSEEDLARSFRAHRVHRDPGSSQPSPATNVLEGRNTRRLGYLEDGRRGSPMGQKRRQRPRATVRA